MLTSSLFVSARLGSVVLHPCTPVVDVDVVFAYSEDQCGDGGVVILSCPLWNRQHLKGFACAESVSVGRKCEWAGTLSLVPEGASSVLHVISLDVGECLSWACVDESTPVQDEVYAGDGERDEMHVEDHIVLHG